MLTKKLTLMASIALISCLTLTPAIVFANPPTGEGEGEGQTGGEGEGQTGGEDNTPPIDDNYTAPRFNPDETGFGKQENKDNWRAQGTEKIGHESGHKAENFNQADPWNDPTGINAKARAAVKNAAKIAGDGVAAGDSGAVMLVSKCAKVK